ALRIERAVRRTLDERLEEPDEIAALDVTRRVGADNERGLGRFVRLEDVQPLEAEHVGRRHFVIALVAQMLQALVARPMLTLDEGPHVRRGKEFLLRVDERIDSGDGPALLPELLVELRARPTAAAMLPDRVGRRQHRWAVFLLREALGRGHDG